MFNAVYDACVLYSATLRDILLFLAEYDCITPFWSDAIHDEWVRSLLRKRPDLSLERLERTRRIMDEKFPRSLVRNYEHIIPTLHLPDINDRHVLAVAIYSDARFIVTKNLKDFPKTVLAQYHIEAITPDDLVIRLIDYDIKRFIEAIAEHRKSLHCPPKTVPEYLQSLEKQDLHQTAVFLREHQMEI
ncbi:MAG: PIN domain-containing protein [Planctomycetaceae bacterium]|jgi:predicted nucleic acid-binding protein|nr:PIN domain-containing protein [Planctomycetaceae bacterium]